MKRIKTALIIRDCIVATSKERTEVKLRIDNKNESCNHVHGWFALKGFPAGELGHMLALAYELDQNALKHLPDPLGK